jgi:ATP-dependent RNA helicase RhlE
LQSAQVHPPADGGFDRFRLDSALVRGLAAVGFTQPRPIQTATIPACLRGRDVLGLAQTGTGKTAAFALPILQGLIEEPGPGPRVLILAPTRELAAQIDAEIRTLARFTEIQTVTVFGGVSARAQLQGLRRRPEIVVGCPGRVLDLAQQRCLDLSGVDTLVLDEADHMFDMGFLRDIEKILAILPPDRQNLLFSATMPASIRGLAQRVLSEPHVVELATAAPAEWIEHALYATPEGGKRALLDELLAAGDCASAIVFTRTKHRAKRLALQLSKQRLRAVALQGNMSQSQRDRAMKGFRTGRFDILVATDIAARGLDVAGIDYVINFDPPSTPETYMHRIGRTGRSEASGKACTFVTTDDRDWVRDTERFLGSRIPRREIAGVSHGDAEVSGGADRAKTRTPERAPRSIARISSTRTRSRRRRGQPRQASERRRAEAPARSRSKR